MDTCLYTSEQLNDDTLVEHTIPESLGGRVRSRFVTSSAFNGHCGECLVPALKMPYATILNRLGPLLPNAHQSGQLRVDVIGEAPGLALDDEGVLTRLNLEIVARDEQTNRPRVIVGANEGAIRQIMHQAGARDDQIILSMVPATSANVFYTTVPVIWKEIEIAALNSVLLTFDHLLRNRPHRFTRASEFDEVRAFIRNTVGNRQVADGEPLHRMSLGLQYQNMQLFDTLRSNVPQPVSPFEHVLFASANVATRTLDLVWLVLGFDPFGFRISGWQGDSFTLVFVNPILRDTECSDLVELPSSHLLCAPTNRRAFPDNGTSSDTMQTALDEVSHRRRDAWEEAVYYVEMNADDLITSNLRLAGDLIGGTTSLSELVSRRLRRMYGRQVDDEDFARYIEQIVAQRSGNLEVAVRDQNYIADGDDSGVSWDDWLQFYRECLDAVVEDHGKPGDAFRSNSGIIQDRVDARALGEQPNH
jgi:hypothetical protein